MAESNELLVHGDTEAAVVAILSAASALTALVPSANISTDLVGYQSGSSWIEVSLEGGTYVYPKFYRPRLDLYVYAPTRTEAIDICHMASAVLYKAAGLSTVYFGTKILDVSTELGPTRVPDRETETPRYVMSFRLTVSP